VRGAAAPALGADLASYQRANSLPTNKHPPESLYRIAARAAVVLSGVADSEDKRDEALQLRQTVIRYAERAGDAALLVMTRYDCFEDFAQMGDFASTAKLEQDILGEPLDMSLAIIGYTPGKMIELGAQGRFVEAADWLATAQCELWLDQLIKDVVFWLHSLFSLISAAAGRRRDALELLARAEADIASISSLSTSHYHIPEGRLWHALSSLSLGDSGKAKTSIEAVRHDEHHLRGRSRLLLRAVEAVYELTLEPDAVAAPILMNACRDLREEKLDGYALVLCALPIVRDALDRAAVN